MKKADPLSPAERAQVDAMIRAGQVTVLPLGANSFEYPRWQGSCWAPTNGKGGFAGSMNRFHGKGSSHRMKRRGATPPLIPAHVAARRVQVAALHAEGMTIPDMVATIGGVSHSAIRNDLARLELEPHKAVLPWVIDHAARERRIRALAAEGKTAHEIAASLPLALDTTRKLAKAYGLKLARKPRSTWLAVGDVASKVVDSAKQRKQS